MVATTPAAKPYVPWYLRWELPAVVPGAIFAALMLWSVTRSIGTSNWAEGLDVLTSVGLPALLVGIIFARLRWLPGWLAHLLSAALGKVRDQELAALPCEYELPESYFTEVKDPSRVNLTRDGSPLGRVNGPGETDDADLGLWCGPNYVNLKRGSTELGAYPYDQILGRLKTELDVLINSRSEGSALRGVP